MAKSYFAILGISPNATGDEIKSAYRRLVKEFHPDHYTGSSERFRNIQEAYSVLGHQRSRREYEQRIRKSSIKTPLKATTYPKPEPLIPEEGPVHIGEVSPVRSFQSFTPSFDEIFDWLWNNFSDLAQPKSARVQNLTLEVILTPEQARRGGNARVTVPAQAVCPTCRGHGDVGFYECLRCAGEGAISGEIPVSVSFPPGLTKDHAVMIPLDRFGISNTHITVLFRPTG
ncbi:MAG: DnaJ domain-containing protein [Desulfobacterales bacterium]|jgi:DnaJ-class molecular chaperone